MITPNYVSKKVVDENGMLTSEWQLIFDQLFSQLSNNFSAEGLSVPPLPAAKIALLTKSKFFTLIGDSDNNVLKVALNNGSGSPVFKTIQTA